MALQAAGARPAPVRSPLWMRLPATRMRLLAAHVLYRGLRLAGYADRQLAVRQGIAFDLDLSEALGLSVFLFGTFQRHVLDPGLVHLPDDATIVDVGANNGTLTLRFAQRAPRGRVFAFEPTDYAFQALRRNLALNPTLAARVEPIKAFLSVEPGAALAHAAYSSWRVGSLRPPADAHPLHGGSLMPATAAPTESLDHFCRERALARLDLIKIDTDGHELEVLLGGRQTLARLHPAVVFEAGLYLIRERRHAVEEYFDLLEPLGYRLVNAKNGHPVTRDGYAREIPLRATTDLLAIPPRGS